MKSILFKPFLTLLFFGVYTLSFAQEVELYLGKVEKAAKRETVNIIGKVDNDFIILRKEKNMFNKVKSAQWEVYNEKMNRESGQELKFPDDDLEVERYLTINDKIYVFMSKYDKDKGINSLFGTTLTKKGKFDNDIYEIVQVKVDRRRNMNSFSVSISEDSTSFLVSVEPAFDKREKQQVNYIVLDQNFKEIDNVAMKFPYDSGDIYISSVLLDRFDNIHILASVAMEETRRKTLFGSKIDKEARLFSIYKGEDELVDYTLGIIKEEEGYLSQIKMKTDNLGKLQCAGFYSDNKGNSMSGVFVFTVNIEDKKIENIGSQDFTDKFINQFLTDRQKRRKARKKEKKKESKYDELYRYKIRDLVMKDGGGFYIVAEYYHFYITSHTNANGATTTTSHYHYNDLMVINVLKDNSVSWFMRIPKRQMTTNDGGQYSGIAIGRNKDNTLNIIYNDHEKNVKSLDPEKLRNINIRKSKAVLISINSNGETTKTPLMPSKQSKTVVMPKVYSQIDFNEILMYSSTRRKSRFIKVVM